MGSQSRTQRSNYAQETKSSPENEFSVLSATAPKKGAFALCFLEGLVSPVGSGGWGLQQQGPVKREQGVNELPGLERNRGGMEM